MRLMVFSLILVFGLLSTMISSAAAGDDRAQQLLKQTRQALGGEEALNGVKGMSLVGTLRREQRSGEIKVSFLLPDKFKKSETMTLIADIELTFTSALNGDQFWTDSSTSGGGGAQVNTRGARQGEGPPAARAQLMRSEFAREVIGLLLASPASVPVEFTYAGEAEAKDGRADVLDVKGPDGFAARLYLDKTTHRPMMMQYRGVVPRVTVNTTTSQTGSREDVDKILKDAKEGRGQMRQARQEGDLATYFSDYRAVDGVMLPHRISKAASGTLIEEWEVKKYKINPSLTARDFEK
ncbi:MAG TPA: hypothetical protein VJH03_23945 [Blastocatellia bacterium]|nr:hypothetical protein [Blastocatellia bacterium]